MAEFLLEHSLVTAAYNMTIVRMTLSILAFKYQGLTFSRASVSFFAVSPLAA